MGRKLFLSLAGSEFLRCSITPLLLLCQLWYSHVTEERVYFARLVIRWLHFIFVTGYSGSVYFREAIGSVCPGQGLGELVLAWPARLPLAS